MNASPGIRGGRTKLSIKNITHGKYLALSTLATKELGLVRILQACLTSMARLKAFKFLNPNPPFAFELHILFQLIQLNFASYCLWPHQKFFIILSMSSHRPWGSRKQLIVYVGIACATALMRISFPSIERSLPFQPASFCPTLSFKIAKTWFFDLPMREGRPRYLVCLVFYIGPRILKTSSLASWAILGLKKIEDLYVLTFWPEASS